MESYKDIINDNLPAWHEWSLKVTDAGITIFLEIYETAFQKVVEFSTGKNLFISSWEKLNRWPLFGPLFTPPTADKWGISETIIRAESQRPGWHRFALPIPRIISEEQVKAGKEYERRLQELRDADDESIWEYSCCFDYNPNWVILNHFRGSLQIITSALDLLIDYGCPGYSPQLLVVEGIMVRNEQWGGALSIKFSKQFHSWVVNRFSGAHKNYVVDVMKKVNNHIFPSISELDDYRFRFELNDDKRIHLSCPGNACGLDPDCHTFDGQSGYSIHPHNTDSGQQQLTLLCGALALADLARQDGC